MTHDHKQRLVPDDFVRLFSDDERATVNREELEARYESAEDISRTLAERFSSLPPDDVAAQRDALRHTLAGS